MSRLASTVASWHAFTPAHETARQRGGHGFQFADEARLDLAVDIADAAIDFLNDYGTLAEAMAERAPGFTCHEAEHLIALFKAVGDTAAAILNAHIANDAGEGDLHVPGAKFHRSTP